VDEVGEGLEEQLQYYRERAQEYDEWALRTGRYDRGAEANARWFSEVAALERALEEFGPRGSVLELACGTGQWTARLGSAERLTALDATAEVLEKNRERMKDRHVEYIHADLFEWEPPERYDVVFFSFWLSHVPQELSGRFWDLVDRCLAPDGRVFFIDNLPPPPDGPLDPEIEGPDDVSVIRRLSDGRKYRVWKILFQPDDLREHLATLGWDFVVKPTGEFFLWAAGVRAPREASDENGS